jgi:hypothetical protein
MVATASPPRALTIDIITIDPISRIEHRNSEEAVGVQRAMREQRRGVAIEERRSILLRGAIERAGA